MKNRILGLSLALGALVALFTPQKAVAATIHNDTQTAILGSGNPDTGWTTSTGGGVEVSLRGKNRTDGTTPNVNGVYSFPTGTVPPANNRAVWNWEWNIDSGNVDLANYSYFLGVDTDPSAAANYTYVNPLTYWADNSYGTAGTANGAGVEGVFGVLPGATIAQQSQNIVFAGLDPNINATWSYNLFAVAAGGDFNSTHLANAKIDVVVGRGGSGGTNVPDNMATFPLLGVSVLGIGLWRRIQGRNVARR